MKDITVIIPLHDYNNEIETLLDKALKSVEKCKEEYKEIGDIKVLIQSVNDVKKNMGDFKTVYNLDITHDNYKTEETDFCSLINHAADLVKTEHFSILEFDDEYTAKWFKMWNNYYLGNESISIFLPIEIVNDADGNNWRFVNEYPLATSFSNELGIIDFECLDSFYDFNLTGGIFNTKDFISIGKFKPSIKVAFNYELLLRYTKKELKVMIVPKEGYHHVVGRPNSVIDSYKQTIPQDEFELWYELAKRECTYTNDRKKNIILKKNEKVK